MPPEPKSAPVDPPTAPAPTPSRRKTVTVVDELADRNISVGYSTVIFRPGQVLTDPYAIALAREHNISTREK